MKIPDHAVEVPPGDLTEATLRNLAEEFVTRDGTDYGAIEKTLEQKVEALLHQLSIGEAKIFFDFRSGLAEGDLTNRLRFARETLVPCDLGYSKNQPYYNHTKTERINDCSS